jgi:hypothetical protein
MGLSDDLPISSRKATRSDCTIVHIIGLDDRGMSEFHLLETGRRAI